MNNTEETIEQALNDFTAENPDPIVEETSDTTDTTTETTEVSTDTTPIDSTDAVVEDKPVQMEVVSPAEKLAAKTDKTPVAVDDFDKKFGIAAKSVTGAENKIPYSRVKKIVTKAQNDAKAEARKEFETEFQPAKFKEFSDKVTDYEGRLTKVAEFENILENEPKKFLDILSRIPAYKEFFGYISKLAEGQAASPTAGSPEKPAVVVDPNDPMPLPNKTNPDGSRVYDLDGLKELMAWNSRQVEQKVTSQLDR